MTLSLSLMYSSVEENYLKALYALAQAHGEANVNMLSKRLDIKMPTVNSMMKKLAEKGLVYYESYKPVRLTPQGMKEAALILRKHRLTEMFLVEKMGFGWEEVHPIAEQIEHIRSARFFEKMDELLGHPVADPHGSPIPDANGHMPLASYVPLSRLAPRKKGTFMAVADSSEAFLKFLNKKEIQLGMELEVLSVEPFDGSMRLLIDGARQEELSEVACSQLLLRSS